MAFLPLGTLAHALTNEDAVATLRSCRNALRPGGLLVVELPHPEDIFNGQMLLGDSWDIEAEAARPALMVEFGSEEHDEFDSATQARRVYVCLCQGGSSECCVWSCRGSPDDTRVCGKCDPVAHARVHARCTTLEACSVAGGDMRVVGLDHVAPTLTPTVSE